MARNFYTDRDLALVEGAQNFSALISAGPEAYGLTPAQAETFAALNAGLRSAYVAAMEPSTRTPVSILAKNTARQRVRNHARLLARIVSATPTVTEAQLAALGLLPRSAPTRNPMTAVAPTVEMVSCAGRLMTLRLRDPAQPTRRGKPYGTLGANIFTFVGDQPPADPRHYCYEGLATRPRLEVLFPNSTPSGATVWVTACWVSRRGEISMSSEPCSFTVQGGSITARTATVLTARRLVA